MGENMKIQEFRKILKAIDECDDSIKSINLHGVLIGGHILSSKIGSAELKSCVEGAIIQRRHNLIERLKMAGVQFEEVV